MIRSRRKTHYRFTEKQHSRKGMIVFAADLVLIILYLIAIRTAIYGEGLSLYWGAAGLLAMILSVVGLGFALSSRKEENSIQLFPKLAVAASWVSLLLWGGTYILGIVLLV